MPLINTVDIKKLKPRSVKITKKKNQISNNFSTSSQNNYQIIYLNPKFNMRTICIKSPVLRITEDHFPIQNRQRQYYGIQKYYLVNLSFDNFNGIDIKINKSSSLRDIFYRKIQQLDNKIKSEIFKNSEKWFSYKLTRHQINNIYESSITYGDSSSHKYDTFQVILPIKINGPDCNIFNKKGHLSRANISRVLRQGSKLSVSIELQNIKICLTRNKTRKKTRKKTKKNTRKNTRKQTKKNESNSLNQRTEDIPQSLVKIDGINRYIKSPNKINYIRTNWIIKQINIEKLSKKRKSHNPEQTPPIYAFLSDSE